MDWTFSNGILTGSVVVQDGGGGPEVLTPNGIAANDLGGSGTFSAWGSEIGALQDFDQIEFTYKAHDAGSLPTIGEIYIQDTKVGPVLASVTGIALVNPTVGTYTIRVELGTTIVNSSLSNLFFSFVTDGRVFMVGENPMASQWTPVHVSQYKLSSVLGNSGWTSVSAGDYPNWKWSVIAVKSGGTNTVIPIKEIQIADCHTVEVRRGWDTDNIKLVLEVNSIKEEYDIHVGADTTIGGVTPTDQDNAITLLTNLLP